MLFLPKSADKNKENFYLPHKPLVDQPHLTVSPLPANNLQRVKLAFGILVMVFMVSAVFIGVNLSGQEQDLRSKASEGEEIYLPITSDQPLEASASAQ